MRRARVRPSVAALLVATAALAGCQRAAEDPAALTPDEQAQLNDAAAMLDANAVDAAAVDGNAGDADGDDANTEDAS